MMQESELEQQIKNCLTQIDKVFPIQTIINQQVTTNFIRDYHTYSSWGYKYLHSREGSLHLAMDQVHY